MLTAVVTIAALALGVTNIGAADGAAGQTDWSGGGGVIGPVSDWGATFADSSDVAWLQWPGRLVLAAAPLSEPVEYTVPGDTPGAIKVLAGDVDIDGDTDLLGVSYWGDRIDLLLNDGAEPPGWRRETLVEGFSRALAVAVADIDGDGLPDILAGADDGAEVSWWQNLGGQPPAWQRHLIDAEVPGAHDVVAADLDGDGDLDAVGVSYVDDLILWWRNDGGAPILWSRFEIAAGFDYPTKVDVADVDGDGDPDVLAVAWLDRRLAWWRNDGGDPPVWNRQEIAGGLTGVHWVTAADIDGDGRVDAVAAAMDLGQVAWWRNEGGSPIVWSRELVTASLRGAVSVAASDLDGDGDLDIAASGWHPAGGVSWWENEDGGGTDWRWHEVASGFGEASSVWIADVDGSGTPDLLASSWSLDRIGWWQATTPVPSGSLTSSVLDTGGTVRWTHCGWIGDAPEDASIGVEARTGSAPDALGPWREVPHSGPCSSLVDGSRYLQYRVQMGCGASMLSPSLDEVSFEWTPVAPAAPRRVTRRLMP